MNEQALPTITDERQKPDYTWLVSCGLVTAVASFLRFFWLELKPMHHDEGVNGYFLTTLFREGVYRYDPSNYHGPTLYYISLAFTKLFGLDTLSVRWSVAIFGVLVVVMAFFLKNHIGRTGSLFAAFFLALSPGMVFISRYFIHEIFFIFCSLGIVLAVLFFLEKRRAGPLAVGWTALLLLICFLPSALNLAGVLGGRNVTLVWILRAAFFLVELSLVYLIIRMFLSWNEGRPIYLLLASASTVLLFATKETAFITVGTMLIACFSVWLWRRIYVGAGGRLEEDELSGPKLTWTRFRERVGASSTWEFVLVNSAIASITIFLVWLAVRFGVDALVAWKTGRSAANIGKRIDLTNVDYAVLALVILFLTIAVAVWIYRKPAKFSMDLVLLTIGFIVIFLYLGALFFSSFFTYPEGLVGAFKAYAIWTKTGTGDHTQNGFWAYLRWGMQVESPIVILSAVGFLIALTKGRHRFALFAGFWSFGMFAAYTLIPYKTPWLALSFILPMCISAGYALNELLTEKKLGLRLFGGLVAAVGSGVLAHQTYDLNFVRYDDDAMPYVYAHTKRGFIELVNQIHYYAEKSGKGAEATVEIVSPDYWPMPWYVNDFPHANFHGRPVDTTTAEMIVAKKDDQDDEMIRRYARTYMYAGTYPLRPGVELVLLVRKDLADSDATEIYYGLTGAPETIVEPNEDDEPH